MAYDNQAAGAVIRTLRLERHMTQEMLSGFAGIARTHLTMIENGRKQASLETLWRLAEALGLRPSQLVERIESGIDEKTSGGRQPGDREAQCGD